MHSIQRLLVLYAILIHGCAGDPDSGSDPGPSADASPSDGAAAACDDMGIDPESAELPCSVETVIADKCQRCHDVEAVTDICRAEGSCFAAPFPLITWADTRRTLGSKLVFERMAAAIRRDFMPLQDPSLNPPVESLTESEKATLLEWLDACAPPADSADPACP